MRHVVYSAWRVFCSCFYIGAWSCLAQDMDFVRHATLLFCAKSATVQGNGAEKETFMVDNDSLSIDKFLRCIGEVKFQKESECQFNVFNLCGVDHYELWHSKIIAHFLSPQGAHGFGMQFLSAFAQCFELGEYSDNVIVRTEVPARMSDVNFGRFDILIEDYQTKTVCIIENKIFASEQSDQLKKYDEWLKRKETADWNTHLVFLTLDGRTPETLNDENRCTCIAYSSDGSECKCLSSWIDRCAEIAKEMSSVCETLCQYKKHINKIATGEHAMNNQIVQEIQKNICAAEKVYMNYQSACVSLANRILIDDIKEKLEKRCGKGWRIQTGLSFSRRESGFLYVPPAKPNSNLKGNIYVIFAETGLTNCQIGIWQDLRNGVFIGDQDSFNKAIEKCEFQKEAWEIEENPDKKPWPIWCPIVVRFSGVTINEGSFGINFDASFFSAYLDEKLDFKNVFLKEIVDKIEKLYNLQKQLELREV